MRFVPFGPQRDFLKSKARVRCLFAGKRSGKSEAAYIDNIVRAEKQIGYTPNGKDPYLEAIIAPTDQMLKKLVWPKFRAFASPFEFNFNKTENKFQWNSNNSLIYGISAEKIKRIEGLKINHIHIVEAFQLTESVFLESLARVSDTKGTITIDGSLGPSIPNPKSHWLYKTFKLKQFPDTDIYEWGTKDNPHFPQDELIRLKDALDPKTFRQMFEFDWDVIGSHLVYDEFDQSNLIKAYQYNNELETYCVVDWGYAHEMACLYFQYDKKTDTVYLFDEIVSSRMSLDTLWDRMKSKPYKIKEYYCDVAGNQEREQTALSNIDWFKDPKRGIYFKYRRSVINYGLPIVRTYIKNGSGQRKFFIDEIRCPKSVDGMKNYRYAEKDGVILNENPIKKDDDCVDAIRYFFVNRLDFIKQTETIRDLSRWGLEGYVNTLRL